MFYFIALDNNFFLVATFATLITFEFFLKEPSSFSWATNKQYASFENVGFFMAV